MAQVHPSMDNETLLERLRLTAGTVKRLETYLCDLKCAVYWITYDLDQLKADLDLQDLYEPETKQVRIPHD